MTSKRLTIGVMVLTLTTAGAGIAFTEIHAAGIAGPNGSQIASPPQSDSIRDAQQALKDEGLYKGPINGELGPETKQAIARFQKTNGLKQTAALDTETRDQLEHADND